MKTTVLALVLGALLIAAAVGLYVGWTHDHLPNISLHGWIALTLGTVLSLALGAGLMALAFISSRRGYDEAADRATRRPDPAPRDEADRR